MKETTFEERLAQRSDEMKWLYMELYDDQHAYEYFVEMIRRCYEKRSLTLREWDDFRTIADDWYRGGELLGYMVYTEQFAGNLEGVREHLEYLGGTGGELSTPHAPAGKPGRKKRRWIRCFRFLEGGAGTGNNGRSGKFVRCLPQKGHLCVPGFRHESHQR